MPRNRPEQRCSFQPRSRKSSPHDKSLKAVELFSFFKLPPEIRRNILYIALKYEKELHHTVSDITRDALLRDKEVYHPVAKSNHVDIGILATSKQMRDEGLPIFYRYNTFRIEIFHDFQILPPWITDPSRHASHLRNVHVHVSNYSRDIEQLSPENKEPVRKVIRTLERCPILESTKVTIIYEKRINLRNYSEYFERATEADPSDFSAITAAFHGICGRLEIKCKRDRKVEEVHYFTEMQREHKK